MGRYEPVIPEGVCTRTPPLLLYTVCAWITIVLPSYPELPRNVIQMGNVYVHI